MEWNWKGETVVAEPIKAWRAWNLNPTTGELIATAQSYTWTAKQNTCKCVNAFSFTLTKGGIQTHAPPEINCGCGFWALKTYEDICDFFPNNSMVMGEIEMWGKIIEGERGYRAEHARILHLYIPATLAVFREKIQERYQVEISIIVDRELEQAIKRLETARKRLKIQTYILFALSLYNFILAVLVANDWFSFTLNIIIGLVTGIFSAGLFIRNKQLKEMTQELNDLKNS